MRYQIIYADPPWQYENDLTGNGMYGQIRYTTMTTDAIRRIPVKDIRADNSVLFMWATFPKLEDAFKVIKGWGFQYVTCAFVWIKTYRPVDGEKIEDIEDRNIIPNIGWWTRSNAELCLLGKHGQPKRASNKVKQVIIAPRGNFNGDDHSAKPAEVRDRIVELMGDLPRVELFARHFTYGWVSLGNDLDGMDITDSITELAYM